MALKSCQRIAAQTIPKIVVTLDLRLYIRAIHLQEKEVIKSGFIFQVGELHTLFAMCRAFRKYIEESGLDSLFVRTGIYGLSTMKLQNFAENT